MPLHGLWQQRSDISGIEFEWHITSAGEATSRNYGLAHYADPLTPVSIDGIPVEVAPGTTILNAARQIGGDIVPPAMCYYSKLEGSGGKCRTCLVKVSKGSEKDPRPMPKLVASFVVQQLWMEWKAGECKPSGSGPMNMAAKEPVMNLIAGPFGTYRYRR
ncbi:hypothetical protein FQR65_LT17978 [Abscondita terminalis]|nr:hypothetical protein FQR65_LT17978 [Abscondita terminalis]